MYINLLPRKLQIQLLARRRLRQWAMVWLSCAAVVSLPCLARYRHVQALDAQVDDVARTCRPLRALAQHTVQLNQQAAVAAQQTAKITALAGEHPWRLLQLIADGALQTQGRLQVQRFGYNASASPAASVPATAPAEGANPGELAPAASMVHLQGITLNDLAIAHFVSGLRQAAFFRDVVLKSSNELRSTDQILRHFEVECHY